MNDKLKWHREVGGGWGQGKEGVGGLQNFEGVSICDGQKGGRAWKILEQREDNGVVSLQAASSRCGGNRASSDFLFIFPSPLDPNVKHKYIKLH